MLFQQVLDWSSYHPSIASIPTALVALGVLVLALVVLVREGPSRISLSFAGLTLAVGAWMFAFSWVNAATDADVALWWSRAAYTGIPFIGTAVYAFTCAVVGLTGVHDSIRRAAWIASCLFVGLGALTPGLIGDMERYPWGYYPQYTWLGVPFIAMTFGLVGLSVAQLARAYKAAAPGIRRRRLHLIMLACIVGWLAGVDVIPAYGLGLYPAGYLGLAGFLVLSAYAVAKYRLVDITPAFASRRIVDTMPDALFVLDVDGAVQLVNRAACEMFGMREEVAQGAPLATLLPDRAFAAHLTGAQAEGAVELEYRAPGSALRYLSVTTSALDSGRRGRVGTLFIVRDVTDHHTSDAELQRLNAELEQRIAERTAELARANLELAIEVEERTRLADDLRRSRDQLDIILNGVADGILVQDRSGHIVFANEAAAKALGFVSLEALKDTPAALALRHFDISDEEGRPRTAETLPITGVLRGEELQEQVVCMRSATTRQERWYIICSTPVFDRRGEVQLGVSIFKDITDRKQVEKTLKELAVRDELTGLFNRRELNRILADEAHRYSRYNRPASLVLLDIDHFKEVNDRYGHPAGDMVLQQVASLVSTSLRATDRAARFGGEEFALVLPETVMKDAYHVAEDLRQQIASNAFAVELPSGQLAIVPVTVSIGVAELTPACDHPEALISAADVALYASKHDGRNRTTAATSPTVATTLVTEDALLEGPWTGSSLGVRG